MVNVCRILVGSFLWFVAVTTAVAGLEMICPHRYTICFIQQYDHVLNGTLIIRSVPEDATMVFITQFQLDTAGSNFWDAFLPHVNSVHIKNSTNLQTLIIPANCTVRGIKISETSLSMAHFEENSNIADLTLSAPHLEQIPETLPNLKGMFSFKLRHSLISSFNLDFLRNFTHLKTFALEQGSLDTIIGGADAPHNDSITDLSFASNKLKRIHWDLFASLAQLEIYNFANNTIEELIGTLRNNKTMTVKLSSNVLKMVDLCNWNPEAPFKFLHLDGNMLTDLPKCIGEKHSLRVINLSRNLITNIDMQAFAHLSVLQRLVLAGNRIATFTITDQIALHRMDTINLDKNCLNLDDLTSSPVCTFKFLIQLNSTFKTNNIKCVKLTQSTSISTSTDAAA